MANRNEMKRIDPAFLMVGGVYQLKSKSLGTANVEYLGGSKIKVVRGELVLPTSGKRLKAGAVLSLPNMHAGDWYSLCEPEVIEVVEDEQEDESQ